MAQHERFKFTDSNELLAKARQLGIDLPFVEDVTPLLTPIEIAGQTLPNRCVIHPMEGRDGETTGAPGELTYRRYERYGAGGCGLIWFEAIAVTEKGRSHPQQMLLSEANLDGFKRLTDATRSAARESLGANHENSLVVQLHHSGRYTKVDGKPHPVLGHHSEVLDPAGGIDSDMPLATDDDLDHLQDDYVHAAQLAREAGFDGVDIKACHGYLLAELLAAYTRDGKYGGSFENRSRLLLETAARIRAEVPGIFVTTRVNAYDGVAQPFGFGVDPQNAGQPDLTEVSALLGEFLTAGCPVANISIGIPYHNAHLGRPFDTPLPGFDPPPEHPLEGVARLLGITAKLQHAWPELPLVGTGYSWLRQFFPNVAAAGIGAGQVSLVGVGRLAFAYPDFVRDLSERGELDPKKLCIACSGCTRLMRAGLSTGCVVRDRRTYKLPRA